MVSVPTIDRSLSHAYSDSKLPKTLEDGRDTTCTHIDSSTLNIFGELTIRNRDSFQCFITDGKLALAVGGQFHRSIRF